MLSIARRFQSVCLVLGIVICCLCYGMGKGSSEEPMKTLTVDHSKLKTDDALPVIVEVKGLDKNTLECLGRMGRWGSFETLKDSMHVVLNSPRVCWISPEHKAEARKKINKAVKQLEVQQMDFKKYDLLIVSWGQTAPPFKPLTYELNPQNELEIMINDPVVPAEKRAKQKFTKCFLIPKKMKADIKRAKL